MLLNVINVKHTTVKIIKVLYMCFSMLVGTSKQDVMKVYSL